MVACRRRWPGRLDRGWLTGKYTRDEPPTGATRLGDTTGRVVTRGVVNLAYAGLAAFVLLG